MKSKYILLTVLGLILVIALIAFTRSSGNTTTNNTANTKLSGSEFVTKLKETPNAILLDVRTPQEFSSGHIENALNIDFEASTFVAEIQKLDKSKTYFVYCRSGNRSAQAISVMKQQGINNIYELKGGIVSNQNLKLTTSSTSETEYVVDPSDMLDNQSILTNSPTSKLTSEEEAGLIQMREEEKLAHDVYITLGNVWGTKIFSNISASEQTHTEAVKTLLTKYGVVDPVTSNTVGDFSSKTMKDLYETLVAKGKTSRTEALIVGATVEDLDIRDLETLKTKTTKEDILTTYNNLQKGSRNHLRAFVKNIQASGSSYTPQYISQNDFNNIISSAQEKGRH